MESTYPTSAQDEYAPGLFTPKAKRMDRKQYTLAFKTDIVRRVESGESIRNVARSENVDQSMIYRWMGKRDTLMLNQSQSSPRIVTNVKGAKFPRLESELLKFVIERRKMKLGVTKKTLQAKAKDLALTCIDDDKERRKFKASFSFVKKFMYRNNLSIRKVTHVSQMKKKDPKIQKFTLINYLARLRLFLKDFSRFCILQCDETPIWFDMVGKTTIEFVGTKSIDLLTSGHDKTRFTVLLTIAAHGFCLDAYVVFKGLKKVPNCRIPPNVVVSVNESGSMDRRLMVDYLRKVPAIYLDGRMGGLVMDSFRAHFVGEVVDCMQSVKLKGLSIPAGETSVSQPLDVVINKPFKGFMEEEWAAWIAEPTTDADYTKARNRKKPSYERLLVMVSNCVARINQNPEMIRKVRIHKLNFKDILNFLNLLLYFIRRSRVVDLFTTTKKSKL